MIDLHSHILPGMDDGSADVKESLWLLGELAGQGVTVVSATPHFYATKEYPEAFLRRRAQSMEQLVPHLTAAHPAIRMGAEVHYFEGMSRAAGLKQLCIEGTPLFLLEMPYGFWGNRMVDEVLELSRTGEMTIVLAHVERYLAHQPGQLWEQLARNGVLFQANAEPFARRFGSGRAMKLLRNGQLHFLGSDCHDSKKRPPRLAQARVRITRALGSEVLLRLDDAQYKWFSRSEVPVG